MISQLYQGCGNIQCQTPGRRALPWNNFRQKLPNRYPILEIFCRLVRLNEPTFDFHFPRQSQAATIALPRTSGRVARLPTFFARGEVFPYFSLRGIGNHSIKLRVNAVRLKMARRFEITRPLPTVA